MTPYDVFLALLVEAALLATLAGLLVRRRAELAWSFAALAAATLTGNVLVTWWPERFYVYWFWVAKETAYVSLQLGVAVEVAWRTFRPFPGARMSATRACRVVLAATTLLVLTAPASTSPYLMAAGELLPRVTNGTVWLMAATLALAHWYRIPIHPFHAATVASLGAYLMVFGTLLRLEGMYGWSVQAYFNALAPPAYLATAAWWAYVAWRPEPAGARARADLLRALGAEGVA